MIGVEEPRSKMVVNFGVPQPGKVDNPKLEEITKTFANSIEKAEKISIGVEEPRSKMVDNFELNLTCLPRTQITLPNPTYRAILIGRRTINYCSSFGREE